MSDNILQILPRQLNVDSVAQWWQMSSSVWILGELPQSHLWQLFTHADLGFTLGISALGNCGRSLVICPLKDSQAILSIYSNLG